MSLVSALLKEQYRDGTNLDARIALHARFSTAVQDFHVWLFGHIPAVPDARVLEIGCGTGAMWSNARAQVPRSWRLALTDFSYGMLSGLRPKFAAWGLSAAFAQCDAQAIAFPGEAFDVVLANHMLYHVPDVGRALGEISRVLKPGGMLVAATNGDDHLREIDELAQEVGLPRLQMWRLAFRLENGAELLAPHFAEAGRYDFDDALIVTEAEPLIAYIVSMSAMMGLMTAERIERLREVVARRLSRDGAIRIRKETGLFVARK